MSSTAATAWSARPAPISATSRSSRRQPADAAFRMIADAGFEAETPCRRLPGTSPKNIVNRPSSGGVQLELTLRLLERLERSGEELSRFSEAVRQAALESLPKITQQAIKEETSE